MATAACTAPSAKASVAAAAARAAASWSASSSSSACAAGRTSLPVQLPPSTACLSLPDRASSPCSGSSGSSLLGSNSSCLGVASSSSSTTSATAVGAGGGTGSGLGNSSTRRRRRASRAASSGSIAVDHSAMEPTSPIVDSPASAFSRCRAKHFSNFASNDGGDPGFGLVVAPGGGAGAGALEAAPSTTRILRCCSAKRLSSSGSCFSNLASNGGADSGVGLVVVLGDNTGALVTLSPRRSLRCCSAQRVPSSGSRFSNFVSNDGADPSLGLVAVPNGNTGLLVAPSPRRNFCCWWSTTRLSSSGLCCVFSSAAEPLDVSARTA
mmetsp:Transcript_77139/g.200652  ORF Transcript_77139/g.200652 Transcript_77139/m.200652 type:complete len:324 (-) Transcript_77139:269-1240(-)